MNWVIGIIVMLIGVFMVMRTRWIIDFTGPIDWAEQHFGGTTNFIKILGVVVILMTFLAATGILGNMVRGIFGNAFSL